MRDQRSTRPRSLTIAAVVLGTALLSGCTFRSSHHGGPHHSGGSVEIGYGGYGHGGYGYEYGYEYDDHGYGRPNRPGRRGGDRCRY